MNYRIVLRKKRYKQSNTIFRVELLCYFALSLCRVISLLHRTVFKTSRHPTKATGNFKHIRRFLGGKQLRVLQIHHTSPQDPQIFNFFRASSLYPMLGIVTHFDTLPQMSNRHPSSRNSAPLTLWTRTLPGRYFISIWNPWKWLTLTTDDITESNSSSEAKPKFCARSLRL